MEIKWRGRPEGIKKRLICPLLAFSLVLGLVAVMPGLNGKAEAVDFDKKCSVTVAPVDPKNTELASDIANADVVVDLYKVADAVPVEGYDTYTYQFLDGYEKLGDIYKENADNADWRQMAQSAAGYALDNGKAVKSEMPVGSAIDNLDCGLYLLIARGRGIADYRTTVKQEDGKENIATVAHSERFVYTYLPELISLPGRQAQNADGSVTNTTAGNGEWQYAMSVNLKPEQDPRYGAIEIVKTLQSYNYNANAENMNPAEFVFQIEAELNGEKVRSTTVSLSFTEAGQKSAIVDQIPIGAVVTVTEVYSGSSYELITDREQTATVEAEDIVSAAFTNDYNETNHGGGSATNHFEYDEAGGQWGWTRVPDNSTSGE